MCDPDEMSIDDGPPARLASICLDCAEGQADTMATFYERLLGYERHATDGRGWRQLRDPRGGPSLNIQEEPWYEPPVWPERPGEPTKMMHFELGVDDVDQTLESVIAGGGCEASPQPADRDPQRLRVILDPAGHPSCLFVAGE